MSDSREKPETKHTLNGSNGSKTNGVKPPQFKRKKFLFVCDEALSGSVALQLKEEGHLVKMYIQQPLDQDVYDGFVEKIKHWKQHLDWADVVVFDTIGFGSKADELRAAGKLVVGGSEYTDRLEADREFGQTEMSDAGMLTPPSWNFNDYDDAVRFLKSHPGRYVFKPSGDVSYDSRTYVFIGKEEDGKDLIEMLEQNKEGWSHVMPNFHIQKFVTGVEIAAGAFFNGKDFLLPVNINFEHKRLYPGDLGPMVGEMGTLMYWSEPNSIFRQTLEKMKEKLRACKYVGYIDINCIANSRGIYPLEFTSRFGYPTISIQMEGIAMPIGEMLYKMAAGELFEVDTKRGFQIGVVIAVPPFPYISKVEMAVYRDSSIFFTKPNPEGVWIGEVRKVGSSWRLAGVTGYALVVTGAGSTVAEARRQAYNRIENIQLQNMFYRTDIGLRWNEDSDRLQSWGYLA